MIIFLLIPVAFLLLLEFIARFIIPVKTIPKIHAQTQRDPYKKELSSPGIVNLEADNNKMFFQTLPNEPFHEPDAILFYRLRRNFTFSWTHTDNSSNTYQTNSLGFR